MAVSLTGTAGLFKRIGAIAAGLNELDTARRGTTDSRLTTLAAEYASNEREPFALIWPQRDRWRVLPDRWAASLRVLAESTLIEQVDRDTALPERTVAAALSELKRQMVASGDSLNRPTVAATVTAAAGNVGDTVLVTSLVDGDGQPLDCVLAETLRATVASTAGSGVGEFTEGIVVEGDAAASEVAYNWPAGSGVVAALTTVDPANDTLVENGGFEVESATTDVPEGWTLVTGTATTHVQLSTAAPRRGDQNLRLVSDGSTLVTLSTPPTQTLTPLTVYAVTFAAKINTVTGTGSLRLSLYDTEAAAITTDAAATANSTTVTLNGGAGEVATSWRQFTAFFRTPAKILDTFQFRLGFAASPPAARTVDIDQVAVVAATQLYPGGPWAAAFAGATSPVAADYWTIAVTNSLGTASLVRNCDRLFSTRQLGIKLPTSGSPTVADALVA